MSDEVIHIVEPLVVPKGAWINNWQIVCADDESIPLADALAICKRIAAEHECPPDCEYIRDGCLLQCLRGE